MTLGLWACYYCTTELKSPSQGQTVLEDKKLCHTGNCSLKLKAWRSREYSLLQEISRKRGEKMRHACSVASARMTTLLFLQQDGESPGHLPKGTMSPRSKSSGEQMFPCNTYKTGLSLWRVQLSNAHIHSYQCCNPALVMGLVTTFKSEGNECTHGGNLPREGFPTSWTSIRGVGHKSGVLNSCPSTGIKWLSNLFKVTWPPGVPTPVMHWGS